MNACQLDVLPAGITLRAASVWVVVGLRPDVRATAGPAIWQIFAGFAGGRAVDKCRQKAAGSVSQPAGQVGSWIVALKSDARALFAANVVSSCCLSQQVHIKSLHYTPVLLGCLHTASAFLGCLLLWRVLLSFTRTLPLLALSSPGQGEACHACRAQYTVWLWFWLLLPSHHWTLLT